MFQNKTNPQDPLDKRAFLTIETPGDHLVSDPENIIT
jgi:hypothetical protein